MFKLNNNDEINKLVAAYVVRRDDHGIIPLHDGDYTEDGFGHFDYVETTDLNPFELLEIGGCIAKAAEGSEVWACFDGVGYRFFFGTIQEVKRHVKRYELKLDALIENFAHG